MVNESSKKSQRIKYRKIRAKALPKAELSIKTLINKLLNMRLENGLLNGFLGIYWPLSGEVDLRYLKKLAKVPLALPASQENGELSFHPWGESPLKRDFCGIPAPLDEPALKAEEMSLLIVPALAIDTNGTRLGYGGGFYDRLRAKKAWRSIPSLVVIPKSCLSDSLLPKDSWDIPFDGWINEEEFFDPMITANS